MHAIVSFVQHQVALGLVYCLKVVISYRVYLSNVIKIVKVEPGRPSAPITFIKAVTILNDLYE